MPNTRLDSRPPGRIARTRRAGSLWPPAWPPAAATARPRTRTAAEADTAVPVEVQAAEARRRWSPSTPARRRSRRTRKPRSSPRSAARSAQIYVEEGDAVHVGPGAGAARRRPPAPRGGPDRGQPAQARARLQAPARTEPRRASSPRARPRTPSSTSTRCARALRQRAPRAELHRDPRADRRRGLGAPHQGRQHDRRRTTRPSASPNLDPLVAYVHVPEKEFRKTRAGADRRSRRRRARRRALRRHDLAHQPDRGPADRHVPRARRGAGPDPRA